MIDPLPNLDVSAWRAEYGEHLRSTRARAWRSIEQRRIKEAIKGRELRRALKRMIKRVAELETASLPNSPSSRGGRCRSMPTERRPVAVQVAGRETRRRTGWEAGVPAARRCRKTRRCPGSEHCSTRMR